MANFISTVWITRNASVWKYMQMLANWNSRSIYSITSNEAKPKVIGAFNRKRIIELYLGIKLSNNWTTELVYESKYELVEYFGNTCLDERYYKPNALCLNVSQRQYSQPKNHSFQKEQLQYLSRALGSFHNKNQFAFNKNTVNNMFLKTVYSLTCKQ